ncbi:MAG: isoprenyl transferase [Bacteroidales bacterium]|mgnify:FL=1|nr:isoprenyl transferase [Bacteroidales bacterium]MBR2050908.1 isoprenyl transferase [Bacteroidales bacterium]
MNSLRDKIDFERLPQHIAVIMDGNGRWAKQQGKLRVFGHQNGVGAVRAVSEACAELGVKYLTLYAFSTENWNRSQLEVDTLMRLLSKTIAEEVKTLNDNNIKLNAIGDLSRLPKYNYDALMKAIEDTKNNDRMTLTLCLSYSGRWEITDATKRIAEKVKSGELDIEQIDEKCFSDNLSTSGMPDPELLVRTSGEERISNFLLWQLAYSEFYFTDKFWPDFGKEDLYQAIVDYQSRERRFGKTSEQITENK